MSKVTIICSKINNVSLLVRGQLDSVSRLIANVHYTFSFYFPLSCIISCNIFVINYCATRIVIIFLEVFA